MQSPCACLALPGILQATMQGSYFLLKVNLLIR